MRVQDARVPLLERHLARLRSGGCPERIIRAASAAVRNAAARWDERYGRMTLVVETDGRYAIDTTDAPSSIDVPGGPVIALVESDEPILPPGEAKPADRSFWDRSLALAREQGADVAVLVTHDGHLIDTSQATLWLVGDGHLCTPPSPPALAGVSRGVVFDLAPGLALVARECRLIPADLDEAQEVFLTTAIAGARAVRGRGGPVTDAIAAAFDAILAGG
jgi:branched-subunit amino acid aminotransferase/4-amino-4-deoxychorismate lyase